MKIDEQILQRHIEAAAADQLARDLTGKGYAVAQHADFGGLQADLVARKGDEVLVYEFKAPASAKAGWARQMSQLKEQAVRQGARFRLVFVRPPRESRVEIDDIESILEEAIKNDFPDALDQLSAETHVDDVSDVEIESVEIRSGEVAVKGTAMVSLHLNDDDGENLGSDRLPFRFDVVLGPDGKLARTNSIDVETSDW
ncbi:hypothetical protein [Azospirillum sp.]|uniref:pPIWI-associating nuclease domain-containing protein n=1 Tax=Azospirillum sp. TaxID=34012 RepID=UPI002D4CB14F|nr:hypothetical protein [Azospirillum sp.]HYD66334.1 hypothetical protein [Azospirillum sp.]